MRRLRRFPLIALLGALCLLGAQRVANAHFIGHLGAAAEAAAFHDSGNGDHAPALRDICTTCAAFAALAAAPPAHAVLLAKVCVRGAGLRLTASSFLPASAAPPYATRAPPAVL